MKRLLLIVLPLFLIVGCTSEAERKAEAERVEAVRIEAFFQKAEAERKAIEEKAAAIFQKAEAERVEAERKAEAERKVAAKKAAAEKAEAERKAAYLNRIEVQISGEYISEIERTKFVFNEDGTFFNQNDPLGKGFEGRNKFYSTWKYIKRADGEEFIEIEGWKGYLTIIRKVGRIKILGRQYIGGERVVYFKTE